MIAVITGVLGAALLAALFGLGLAVSVVIAKILLFVFLGVGLLWLLGGALRYAW